MTSTPATQYAAQRHHTSPSNDEHAAMCWIRKAGFATEDEARAALVVMMLEEIHRDGVKDAAVQIIQGENSADSGKIRWTITSY